MNINSLMTPRLIAVAEMVKEGSCVADIGTDHAYVPVYLVLSNISKRALAMDINRGPLMRAEENVKRFNLGDKIKTRISDGLKEIKNGEADTVIIAGMGGILINNILDNNKERLSSVKHYILQPMTAVEETRKYLADNGFLIENERLVAEDDKIYTVISAVFGITEIKDEIDYYVGRKLVENRDKLLPVFLQGKIYEYEKAIASMKKSTNENIHEKLLHFEYLLKEFKRLKEECAKW